MPAEPRDIGIAGAGLVGSLLATVLAQRGCAVTVYEKRSDMRKGESARGRSINLALSERGWKALRLVGLDDKVRQLAIPMKGRLMHSESGELTFQPYGVEGQAINSVSRAGLNMVLMDAAEEAGASLKFEVQIDDVDFRNTALYFGKGQRAQHDILFGADGAFSAVRLAMMTHTDRFDYSQQYIAHGYKELIIPADAGGGWRLEKNVLHIWPRHSFMLIALPNIDGSFTCTLFFPFEGDLSFTSLKNPDDVRGFFARYFPDALPYMPTLTEDFFSNPTSSLVTVKCYPWCIGHAALIGDAAHAIVPFFGQGMNAGFEDCTVLGGLLDRYDWPEALDQYQSVRKPNGDAIAELAQRNFIEMRDKVADADFINRKRLFKALHERYPGEFMPVYSMVSFSHMDYKEALAQDDLQDRFYWRIREEGLAMNEPSGELLDNLIALWRREFA